MFPFKHQYTLTAVSYIHEKFFTNIYFWCHGMSYTPVNNNLREFLSLLRIFYLCQFPRFWECSSISAIIFRNFYIQCLKSGIHFWRSCHSACLVCLSSKPTYKSEGNLTWEIHTISCNINLIFVWNHPFKMPTAWYGSFFTCSMRE
jgi:hypothetical protein